MRPPLFLDDQCSTASCPAYGHQEHVQLDRAAAYIRGHFDDELSLDELARVAGFSKYHFHRLFTERFRETVGDYVRRIRLEKAALKLIAGSSSSITRIAFDCGFSSSQHFAKSFKRHFGVSPIELQNRRDWGNIFLKKIKNMEIDDGRRHCLPVEIKSGGAFVKIPAIAENGGREDVFQELDVMDMPSYRVAYVRTRKKNVLKAAGQAMDQVVHWAAPKGLLTGNAMIISAVGIVPDLSGEYTYDASVTVPAGVEMERHDDIQIQYLPGGLYAVYHGKFQDVSELTSTWESLTCGWWVSSYFPRDRRPCYEIYYNDPAIHPSHTSFVDLCLPIAALNR